MFACSAPRVPPLSRSKPCASTPGASFAATIARVCVSRAVAFARAATVANFVCTVVFSNVSCGTFIVAASLVEIFECAECVVLKLTAYAQREMPQLAGATWRRDVRPCPSSVLPSS